MRKFYNIFILTRLPIMYKRGTQTLLFTVGCYKFHSHSETGIRLLHASMTLRIPVPEHGVNCNRFFSSYILNFFLNSFSVFFFWKINSPASTRKLMPEQITEGYLNRIIPVHTRIMGIHPAMAAWIR